MTRPPRKCLQSEHLHVTLRGMGRRALFEDVRDRRRFLEILRVKLAKSNGQVLAWCLMENHVHLLIRIEAAALSKLMQRTCGAYAQYFNGCHGHVGKVFQNRFAAQAVQTDEHLLTAIRYIHHNAKDAGATHPAAYPWCSFREIARTGHAWEGAGICDTAAAIALFGNLQSFLAFHERCDAQDELDNNDEPRPRLSDAEARRIALGRFGTQFSDDIPALPQRQRNDALRELKNAGLSVRQIERLTGIGRGIITRA